MDPLDLPARHAVSPSPADAEAGLQLSAKTSGELLFLISDFLASVPGGDAASRQFVQSAHDAGVLPLTRTYTGAMRRITPTELSRAAGSVKATGLLTIVQDWIARHGLSTLISAPNLPQPRPPHSIVDTLRLRQTQPSTPHPLASTMRKFEQIGSLFGHTHETYCIMFDRTHSRLITGSNDWIIKIWCAQTGWLLHSLRGHLGPVDYLTINRENTMIASGCHDGVVRVWALATGKPVATLRTPQVARHPDYPNAAPDEPNARINRITAIVWSTTPFPENRVIVAATKDDGMLRVWRWVRGETTHEPARFLYPEQPLAISFKTRETDYPVCLSMDPSGLFLAAGGSDGVVRVYSTGPLVRHRFDDPPVSVFGDGSSSSPSTSSAATGLPPLPVPPGGAPVPAATAASTAGNNDEDDAMDVDPPGGPHTPAPPADANPGTVPPAYPLLQPADMPCIAYLKHDGPMVDVQFSNKGDRLLAYAEDGQAHVWSLDATSGQWTRVPLSKDPIVPDPALAPPTAPGRSQSNAGGAGSSSQLLADSQIAADGTQQPKRKRRKKRSYDVVSSCWLEGDNYLVTTNLDGFIRVFESRTGQLVNAFRGDSLPDLSPDDPGVIDTLEPHPQMPDVFLTACSSSGYVALWHREATQPLWSRKHSGVVSHCDISADGWTIAVSLFNDDLDPTGSQVTKLYAIAREALVAPEEQFFASDRDLIDHTAAVPWLYDHAHPYFDEHPQYVRPRGGDTYPGQPALAYRTSLPAGMPYNQLSQEDLTTADQARMLVGHVFSGYRVVEMSREEREAHAKAVGKRGRARRVAPPTPQFQLAVHDVEPLLALPMVDVDDPDDEDYHEGGSDGDEAGGSAGADGLVDHASADELGAAFHAGTDDDDLAHASSSSTSRRRNMAAAAAAATPSPSRRSRRRATQNSHGAAAYDDNDDPAFLATLRAIQDMDSGDDYEAPAHWIAGSSSASASVSAGGGGGGRRLVRRASSSGSAAATSTPARSTRLRRSASNQSDAALDSPSRGTRARTRRTRSTNHMYDESLTRGLDMSGSDRDELTGLDEEEEGRPQTRASRRIKRLRLHAVDESADENVPIPSSAAAAAATAGTAGVNTRRSKRRRVGSDDDDGEEEERAAAAASSSSSRPRRAAAAAAAPGRGSPARNRSLRISDEESDAEEEEAIATHSDSTSEAEGMQEDDESSMESSSNGRPRRRAAAVAVATSGSLAAATTDLLPTRSSQRARQSTRAPGSASSSTPSQPPAPRLTRRSSGAELDAALAAAAANEPPRYYPSWMYATTHDPYSYAPQLGDCIAFFPEGYSTFLEAHETQCIQAGVPNIYVKARVPTVSSRDSSTDHFFAVVHGIKVQPGGLPDAFQIELTLVRCDRGHKTITVRYEGTGFPDFIQLRSRLKYALDTTGSIGITDDVSVMADDGAWEGTVIDVRGPAVVWGKFQVQWEEPAEGEAESDVVSPWEIQSKLFVDSRDASERLPDAVEDKVKRLLRRVKHIAGPANISVVVPGQHRPISTGLISQRLEGEYYRHPQELAADLDRLRRSTGSSANRDAAVTADRERLAEVIQQLMRDYPLPDAASIVLDDEHVVHSGYDSGDQGFAYGAGADSDIVMGVAAALASSSSSAPLVTDIASSLPSAAAGNGRGGRSAKARAAVRISANSWHPSSSPDLADLARETRRSQARNASASSSRASSVSTVSTVTSLPAAPPAGTGSRPRRAAAAVGASPHFSIEVPALTRARSSVRPSTSVPSISTLDSRPEFDEFMGDASSWAAPPPPPARPSRSAAAASHLSYAPQRSSDMEDEFLTQPQTHAPAAASASSFTTATRPSGRGPSTARRTSNGSAGSGKFPHRSTTSSDWFADPPAAAGRGSSDFTVEDELGASGLGAHQPRRAAVAALQGISHAARGIMSPTRGMPQSPPGPKRKSKRLSNSGAAGGGGTNYAEWDSDGQDEVEASDEEAVMQMSSEEEEEEDDDLGYAGGRAAKRARYN